MIRLSLRFLAVALAVCGRVRFAPSKKYRQTPMPAAVAPLTAIALSKAKPGPKPYKLRDGGGLYLLMPTNGLARWCMDYRRPLTGQRNTLGFGAYPTVTLADARGKREAARRQLAAGIDPGEARKEAKATAREAAEECANTFAAVAEAWAAWKEGQVAENTAAKNRWLLDTYLLPDLGPRPIREIMPRHLLDVLRKIEDTGKLEAAKRAKTKAGEVFRYAVREGVADSDPTASLKGALKAPNTRHRPAITDPARIGGLMRSIDGYPEFVVRHALQLLALTFVRPGELRLAQWEEFDLDGAIWRIPGERMKMKAPHLVPLSAQAITLLKDLLGITGGGALVFPGIRKAKPLSENTFNSALRSMGYSGDVHVAHGFRSMAATRLNEMGTWSVDAIERQLAHAESNKVRAAYTSQAQYLPERTKMMQAWADYLDDRRADKGNVVAFRPKVA